jgi:serine/threonine-protein kinase Chk2
MGRFDYPSPYWDSVGDPALDLIDRMLTVDVSKRITIDECLEHPWTRNATNNINPADSTDGLTGAMDQLDFSKRKVQRERTLLATMNDIKVGKVVKIDGNTQQGRPEANETPTKVKVWEKNPDGKLARPTDKNGEGEREGGQKEEHPAGNRQQEEFMEMGGKGDMQLFADDVTSRYAPVEKPNQG